MGRRAAGTPVLATHLVAEEAALVQLHHLAVVAETVEEHPQLDLMVPELVCLVAGEGAAAQRLREVMAGHLELRPADRAGPAVAEGLLDVADDLDDQRVVRAQILHKVFATQEMVDVFLAPLCRSGTGQQPSAAKIAGRMVATATGAHSN